MIGLRQHLFVVSVLEIDKFQAGLVCPQTLRDSGGQYRLGPRIDHRKLLATNSRQPY